MEDEVWTTKDGRELKVGDMNEHHVKNALRMVIRRERRRATLRLKLIEVRPRLVQQLDHALEIVRLREMLAKYEKEE